MQNSFHVCKTHLYQARCKEMPIDLVYAQALKEKASAIWAHYQNICVSRAKAEVIAYLLQNMKLTYHPEDLFATDLQHGSIMADFLLQNTKNLTAELRSSEAATLEAACAIKATMDFGHIAPDWQYLLSKGIPGIIADLEICKATADAPDYYDERILVYRAIGDFFLRFADHIRKAGTEKAAFVSQNLCHLASNPPQTLAQAMQLILIYYVLQTNLDTVLVRTLGGLDRLLYPYYKSDLERGRYTAEELGEFVRYFFWDIYCMKVTANLPFYICGTDENGFDATNPFTVFLLEKYRELDIYDPKIHVLYHENIDQEVLRLILEMIREGKNSFVFMNTAQASKALQKIGIAETDAKRLTVYGCYEAAAEGTEIPCTCAGMVNMPKALETVICEHADFSTFNDFYASVIRRLFDHTMVCMDTISAYEGRYNAVCPSLMMSPTYQHSRQRGVDVYSGGVKYNNTSIVGIGLATLVDSLIAVKNVVFEEKKMSYSELRKALLANWQGQETLRLQIRKDYPKFGNHQSEADKFATDIYEGFAGLINNRSNGRGGVFRCGMFSVDWRFWMGKKTGATPDGRYSGEPLSKNLAPSAGQDKNGVTAYLQSVLAFDSTLVPDGYVADVTLHESAVKGEAGMQAFWALLITFMQEGGYSIHFNVLNPDTLLQAQKEPENYRNLQIRLCGWNVRFVDLDKAQQDEFIQQAAI